MSPAPETVRNNNPSPPSLSISTILSRAPRAPHDSPSAGPFSADRRAVSSIRRNFSSSGGGGGPRPAPFQRQVITLNESNSEGEYSSPSTNTATAANTRAFILSALESRRRRIEELRSGSNIATTIAEQWRRQRDSLSQIPAALRPTTNANTSIVNDIGSLPEVGPLTPPQRFISVPPRLFLGEESSDSDSEEDDDPDNKFSTSMNEVRRTPPPTFLTPNASPSTTASPSSKQNDDDSSRNAYTLSCKFCANVLTERGMRARLVADARVHIWSTDEQPKYSTLLTYNPDIL
jgi:FAM72 protein